VACGELLPDGRYLAVLDIDPRNGGDDELARLESEHETLPETPTQLTGGGGLHYFFATKDPVASSLVADGVELKGKGSYVLVAPSNHKSGRQYTWDVARGLDIPIADLPEWVDVAKPRARVPGDQDADPRDTFMGKAFEAAGMLGNYVGKGRRNVKCPWMHEHSGSGAWDQNDTSTVLLPPRDGEGMGRFHCLHSHCTNRTAVDVLGALPADAKLVARRAFKPVVVPVSAAAPKLVVAPAAPEPSLMLADLKHTMNGQGTMSLDLSLFNATRIFSEREWEGVLGYDEMKNSVVAMKPPPFPRPWSRGVYPEAWTDSDDKGAIHWVSSGLLHAKWPREVLLDGIQHAAERNRFNQLVSYLRSIQWDGVSRVDDWLIRYAGASDTSFVRAAGRMWLISAIARAMKSGCQADHTLVLIGSQGAGKSMLFKTLGGQWFTDDLGDITTKDASERVRGFWIIEVAEMTSLAKADITAARAFLTRKTDTFREAYGRRVGEFPRKCVFGGSVNEIGFLSDPTGNRRFWPVTVGVIDLPALQYDRDQILAEAVALYDAGEQWWPSHPSFGEQETEKYRSVDPWEALVDTSEPLVTVRDVLDALGLEARNRTRAHEVRVTNILQRAGYMNSGKGIWKKLT
jgi:hypothetical protein